MASPHEGNGQHLQRSGPRSLQVDWTPCTPTFLPHLQLPFEPGVGGRGPSITAFQLGKVVLVPATTTNNGQWGRLTSVKKHQEVLHQFFCLTLQLGSGFPRVSEHKWQSELGPELKTSPQQYCSTRVNQPQNLQPG